MEETRVESQISEWTKSNISQDTWLLVVNGIAGCDANQLFHLFECTKKILSTLELEKVFNIYIDKWPNQWSNISKVKIDSL